MSTLVVLPPLTKVLNRVSRGGLARQSSGRFYTNYALQSINQNNASWANTGLTSKLRNATAPDGVANTATTLLEDGTTNNHQVAQNLATTLPTRTIWTYSAWFKAGSGTRFPVLIALMTGNSEFVWQSFDLAAVALKTTTIVGNYVVLDKGIKATGNGWFRCWLTFLTTNTNVTNSIRLILSNNGNGLSYTGDSTSSLLVWGAQLEPGFGPTNLIRTTTTILTVEETDALYGN